MTRVTSAAIAAVMACGVLLQVQIQAKTLHAPGRAAHATVTLDDPCDNSGDGYYALCAGIALQLGGRLFAPGGVYRMYFSEGCAYVLDTSPASEDDWFIVAYVAQPCYSSPSHFEFDWPGGESGYGTLNLTAFQYCESGECPYYNLTSGNADGEAYFAVDDDGCARIYDQDGGRVRYNWCPDRPVPPRPMTRLAQLLHLDVQTAATRHVTVADLKKHDPIWQRAGTH